MGVLISPSILSADFSQLGHEIARVEKAGADRLHLDVMDGHFVPNLTFGAPVIEWLRPLTTLPMEAHLMIQNPDQYLDDFIKAGVNDILVHPNTCPNLNQTLARINEAGIGAGLVVNPKESADIIGPYLDRLSQVLVMTVEPGFGGQSFMGDMLPKIQSIKELIAGRPIDLSVDGGISSTTAPAVLEAGATILVAGSAIFKPGDMAQHIKDLRGN